MSSALVLGNPSVADGRAQLAEVVDACRRRGVDATAIEAPTVSDAREATVRAAAEGAARLIAVGGDGVVHIAVNAVAESETVLGVVPLGTGNDFARALGLVGGSVDEQVERALADASPVDAIRTGHGWVASVATLGFSGDVTARANALAWPRGPARYTVATMLQLPRLRTLPVKLEVEGRQVGAATTLLAIGNTAYFGGGMQICPNARPDDGQLQAVSIGDVPRHRFARVFPTVFSGGHMERPEVSHAAGSWATIDGPADIDVWADGERLGPLPIRLDVVRGAVQVAGRGAP